VLWVADTANHRIRRLNLTTGARCAAGARARRAGPSGAYAQLPAPPCAPGAVVTVAGAGIRGFADGPAPASLFSAPRGVAAGASGAVYVAGAARRDVAQLPGRRLTRPRRRHGQRAHPRRGRRHGRGEHAGGQRQPRGAARRQRRASHVSHAGWAGVERRRLAIRRGRHRRARGACAQALRARAPAEQRRWCAELRLLRLRRCRCLTAG